MGFWTNLAIAGGLLVLAIYLKDRLTKLQEWADFLLAQTYNHLAVAAEAVARLVEDYYQKEVGAISQIKAVTTIESDLAQTSFFLPNSNSPLVETDVYRLNASFDSDRFFSPESMFEALRRDHEHFVGKADTVVDLSSAGYKVIHNFGC